MISNASVCVQEGPGMTCSDQSAHNHLFYSGGFGSVEKGAVGAFKWGNVCP